MASAVSTVISSNDHAESYISTTTAGVKDGSEAPPQQEELGEKGLDKEKVVDVTEVSVPWTDDEIAYPDGGVRAWLVVAGAMCCLGSRMLGGYVFIYLTFGAFPDAISDFCGYIY
ncbi:hypothetical protein EST38_g2051 [Candolleomyces aberdarensis]|uniref:Uncharacterized protein n=1 Tax=Candolleomyces aberdarensis TaxID=2316362 RepID=A0A4Q2DUA1_9AGAR|nr:hypothetical protein EST38_g2051 [Candolleomyces aberdarensis]